MTPQAQREIERITQELIRCQIQLLSAYWSWPLAVMRACSLSTPRPR